MRFDEERMEGRDSARNVVVKRRVLLTVLISAWNRRLVKQPVPSFRTTDS